MVQEHVEANEAAVDVPERCHPSTDEGVQKGEARSGKVGQVIRRAVKTLQGQSATRGRLVEAGT